MAGIFFIVGLALIFYWLYLRRRSVSTAQWPSVPGQIVESKLIQVRDEEASSWQLQLAYKYQVAGAEFQSRRVSFAPVNAQKTAKRFPTGAMVNVFYDPKNPGSAILEHPAPTAMHIVLALGSIFAAIGLILMFV